MTESQVASKSSEDKWGIVLLNMGGPSTTADVRNFLEDLLSDPAVVSIRFGPLRRWIARRAAKKRYPMVVERYEAIGGGSPILSQTMAQARALTNSLGGEYPIEVAMRYTAPRAVDAVSRLAEAGVNRVLALPLYPQYCGATTGSSFEDLGKAAAAVGMQVSKINEYPTLDGFIEAIAEQIDTRLPYLQNPRVIFSAHGIPERMASNGDPYPKHIQQTVDALAARLPKGVPFKLAFQSRLGPVKWLQPDLEDTIRRFVTGGQQDLLVVPVSFVSEHIETLWELDIEMYEIAEQAGGRRYERVPTVQTHPSFIDSLAELVCRTIERSENQENL